MNVKTITAFLVMWLGTAVAGGWDTGSFENDDALDWVWELSESDDLGLISRALRLVTDNTGYLEAPDASMAIAAAEVVAALRGYPSTGLPQEVSDWVRDHQVEVDDELAKIAREVVKRVANTDSSELAQLWAESEDFTAAWHASLTDLLNRLE